MANGAVRSRVVPTPVMTFRHPICQRLHIKSPWSQNLVSRGAFQKEAFRTPGDLALVGQFLKQIRQTP